MEKENHLETSYISADKKEILNLPVLVKLKVL